MDIRIFSTRAEMGYTASAHIAGRIDKLLKDKECVNMIFAAAPSQNEVLEGLVNNRNIRWDRVNAFHMDEYIGIGADAPQRFGNFLKDRIFGKVNFRSVNYIDAEAGNADEACKRYASLLDRYPPDIVVLGIGENGHIAFNDPHVALFNDPKKVKCVGLDEKCRAQQVNDGCFKRLEDVPKYAVTLTIPALLSSAYMFCVVPAMTKAQAVERTVNGPVSEACPASILRTHNNVILYLDKDSASLL